MDNEIIIGNLEKAMDELGKEFVIELKRQIAASGKRATNTLINSINYKLNKEDKNDITITIIAEDYLKYVDQGFGPAAGHSKGKMMSINTIERKLVPWMKAVGIQPRNKKSGRFITYKSVGFLIARKIQKDGVPGTHVIVKTYNSIFNRKKKLLTEASIADFKTFLKKTMTI
jgi:hypothetical protein